MHSSIDATADHPLATQLIARLVFLVGFLLPYVFVEPAPVDVAVIILPILVLLRTRMISKDALRLAGVYTFFSVVSIAYSSTFVDVRPRVLISYCIVQTFLLIAVIFLYEVFRSSREMTLVFLRGYIVGAAVSSIIVLFIHYSGGGSGLIYRDEFAVRIKGFFKDPNVLGPFLIFPAAAVVFCREHLGLRWHYILAFAPISLLLVLTYSRAAMGGLFMALLFSMASYLQIGVRLRTVAAGLAALLLVALVALGSQDTIASAISRMNYLESRLALQGYDTHRVDDIALGLRIGVLNPLGIGPGIFGKLYDTSNPHNLFVGKLVDVGVVPALLMVWLIVYATLRSLKYGVMFSDAVTLALFGALLAHVLISMIIYSHHWRHMLYLSVVAIAYTGHLTQSKSPSSRKTSDSEELESYND